MWCETYKVNVYMGLQEGYDGSVRTVKDAIRAVRKYTDEVGLGVTVTPTYFVYTGGDEPGVIIGLVNYPRFPSDKVEIRKHGFELAKRLLVEFKQHRCTVELPDRSVLLENPEIDGNVQTS